LEKKKNTPKIDKKTKCAKKKSINLKNNFKKIKTNIIK